MRPGLTAPDYEPVRAIARKGWRPGLLRSVLADDDIAERRPGSIELATSNIPLVSSFRLAHPNHEVALSIPCDIGKHLRRRAVTDLKTRHRRFSGRRNEASLNGSHAVALPRVGLPDGQVVSAVEGQPVHLIGIHI